MFEITPYTRRSVNLFDPFRELENLEKSFFSKNYLTSFSTDIRDNGDSYLLEADLPGFNRENIKIDIKDGCMTVSAERRSDNEKKDKDNKVVYSERSYGSFSRSFDVSGINEDAITAEYRDGVLKVVMPKKEAALPEKKSIEVK